MIDGSNEEESVLSDRNFQLLWIGEGISVLGDQFHMIALPWLVLQLTNDPFAMGTVLALEGIPRALLMLVGGVVTDRFSPRSIMLASNIARLILVALLAILVLTNSIEIWMLYVMGLLFGTVGAFFFPAANAIIPSVIKDNLLAKANALIQGTVQLSVFAGPMLAGAIIAMFSGELGEGEVPSIEGIGVAFVFNAATFVVSTITLWMMDVNKVKSETKDADEDEVTESVIQSIKVGLRYVWNNTVIRVVFVIIAAINLFLAGPLGVGIPVVADDRFAEGAAAFGMIMSAMGGGNLIGIAFAGFLPKPSSTRMNLILIIGVSMFGIGEIALAFATTIYIAVFAMFIMGLGNGYMVVLFVTWLQRSTPSNML